jgi:N-acyl-D-amino-acid deacylase
MKIKIINGLIVDGTNTASYKGNIVIKNGRVNKILHQDTTIDKDATYYDNIIDAEGLIVSPGFIDIHTHSDTTFLSYKKADSKILQGVTTEITGNCGGSKFPVKLDDTETKSNPYSWKDLNSYIEYASNFGSYTNLGMLVGHGTLRRNVANFDDREVTKSELNEMCEDLDKALEQGAFGMSLGLIYIPGVFSSEDELIELSKVLASKNRILSVHIRNESDRIFEAIEEMLNIAKKSKVRLQISHLKLAGKNQWGKSDGLLRLIENAKMEGIDINCDQYPYEASYTSLASIAPRWAQDGGSSKLISRLKNPSEKLINDMLDEIENRGGASGILVLDVKDKFPQYENKRLSEISKMEDTSPIKALKKIIIETNGDAKGIFFCMSMDDVMNIMKSPFVSVGSDGSSVSTNPSELGFKLHPRNFGTFPKFLQIVRENGLMPIENAVYKMTGLNAHNLRINDRGTIKEGNIADITIFDKDLVKDNSTYISPAKRPTGIEHVIVNGKIAVYNNQLKLEKSGVFLRKD